MMRLIPLLLMMSLSSFADEVIYLEPGPNIRAIAQEKIIGADPGTTIVFPEGKFNLTDEIIVNVSHITIKGQGPDKTILSFKNQQGGAQGILATEDAFTLEDIAIEDPKGDGVKVEKANGVTLRRVRVEWTNGPATENGAYGFYPVQTQNVLIEECIVKGASDAGIYVGQSRNIIVRNNIVEWNVAGIEIENSTYADVHGNQTRWNTAGILVFDLPNLKVKGGKRTRIFDNHIVENNVKNFAPKGNIVGLVPAGTGVMVIANDDIEIFNNRIIDNVFTSVVIVNYHIAGYKIEDPLYDPKPEKVHIHNNIMSKYEGFKLFPKMLESENHFLIYYLTNFNTPHIVYGGIDDGTYNGPKMTKGKQLCVNNNKQPDGSQVRFANLHLDSGKKSLFGKIPGGPATYNIEDYTCSHPNLEKIVLEEKPPKPAPPKRYTASETISLCKIDALNHVNWKATVVDCPKLSDYNLFADSSNPTADPLSDYKVPYDLSSTLFTDYALKDRFIFLPPGESMDYSINEVFRFPVGTIISKTFSYPTNFDTMEGKKWLETRLLIHRENGWVALEYVWDHDKNDAFLSRGGAEIPVSFIRKGKKVSFTYQAPSQNKCFLCHNLAGKITPIGPQAKFLNSDLDYPDVGVKNQLKHLREVGALTGIHLVDRAPKAPDYNDEKADLTKRAKAYLHINCAHCHNPKGRGKTSALFMEYERDHKTNSYGRCKPPVAAGKGAGNLNFIVQPGSGKDSILHYRTASNDIGSMMPEVGRVLVHKEGIDLIEKWIDSMEKVECNSR